jgi:hypothetical protein
MYSATKPQLRLCRTLDGRWEWWGRIALTSPFAIFWIRLGAARYLTVAEVVSIYRSAW